LLREEAAEERSGRGKKAYIPRNSPGSFTQILWSYPRLAKPSIGSKTTKKEKKFVFYFYSGYRINWL